MPPGFLRFTDPQDGLDGCAALGIGHGPVDVTEGIKFEEAVKGEAPCLVESDQSGDEALGHGVSLDMAMLVPFRTLREFITVPAPV